MKKILLLVAAFLFLGIGAQAQSTMSKGQLVGSARLGFSNGGIPLAVAVDYGIANGFINGNGAFSAGGELGLFMWNNNNGSGISMSAAARANLHYEFVSNLDTYFGVKLGILNGFDANAYIGGRYYFGKLAVNLELGGGLNNLGGSIGVSMKL